MTKHTPGPWEVEYDDGEPGHVIRMGSAIDSRGNYFTEEIINYEHGLYEYEATPRLREQFARAEANALLIAAAPELLEALGGLLAALGDRQFKGAVLKTASAAARAAIAKATGAPEKERTP